MRITKDHVVFTVGDETKTVPADLVIMAAGVSPAAPLAEALVGEVADVHVIGDAKDVQYIEGAIHSAWKIATIL